MESCRATHAADPDDNDIVYHSYPIDPENKACPQNRPAASRRSAFSTTMSGDRLRLLS
jgi:hypothetical protein